MPLFRLEKLPIWVNMLAVLYILTIFILKPVHNFAFIALALIGLGYGVYLLKNKQNLSLRQNEKWFCYAILFYTLLRLITFGFHDDRFRHIDTVSQLLVFLPSFFLLRQFKVSLQYLLYAIPISAIIAFSIAAYDRFYLGLPLPFGNMIHIQAGDMAMSLGLMSFCLFFYARQKTSGFFIGLCVLGILSGMGASVLSTARGGWIGLPFILVTILYIFRHQISKKLLGGLCAFIVIGMIGVFVIPQTQVSQRIDQAKFDVTQYFEHNNPNTSIGMRFEMWKGALLMAQERPLAGVGEIGFKSHFKRYAGEGKMAQEASDFAHAHNLYLDNLAKDGILALLSLLVIFFVPFVGFVRAIKYHGFEQKVIGALGVVHILAVMFYGLSEAFFSLHLTQMFYFFLIFVFYSMVSNTHGDSIQQDS